MRLPLHNLEYKIYVERYSFTVAPKVKFEEMSQFGHELRAKGKGISFTEFIWKDDSIFQNRYFKYHILDLMTIRLDV